MYPKRLLIAISLLFFVSAAAQAQSVPSSSRCISGCNSPSPSRSSPTPTYTPSPEELERQRQEQEQQRRRATAHYLNEQGIAAFERKDYVTALRAFQQAHELNPDSVAIQHSLASAQDELGVAAYINGDWKAALDYFREAIKNNPEASNYAENLKRTEEKYQAAEGEKDRRVQDAATAEQMRGTIGQLSSTVASTPAVSTPGLDFGNPDSTEKKTSLEFDQMRDAPNDPKGAKSSTRGVTPGGNTKASDQLKSAAEFGTVPPGRTDAARRNTFDNHGTANGSLDTMVVDGRGGSRQNSKPVPAVVANDPRYKALQGQKVKLEAKYKELDTKLQEIRQQQKTGQGDQGALKVEAAKIKSELPALKSQMGAIEIKKHDIIVSFEEDKPAVKKARPEPPAPH